ncbi:MAG: zeta toxin family protein [Prevotellaceae bacterium]|jgi:predicted ABC-type ATPase|nr:zeta toxin family protein [Prevotellaceae bacterium]
MQATYNDCVNAGQLSIEENLQIYKKDKIFERTVTNTFPRSRPTAIILGGQNASGKSSLGDQFLKEYKQIGCGIVRIEGDALREYHPKFHEYNLANDKLMAAYTAKDSGEWIRRLIEDTGKSRRNMLIETTLRNPNIVGETARLLHEGGYDVQIKANKLKTRPLKTFFKHI